MNNKKWIRNVQMVLPDQVLQGDLLIEADRIAEIRPKGAPAIMGAHEEPGMDGQGMYLMPGIIDIHSDVIEKEIQPRPGSFFPLNMALIELEKKLAGHGVTTMYHSVSLADGVGVRNNQKVVEIIEEIYKYRQKRHSIRHRIHLRYEVTNLPGIEIVENLIRQGRIDLLSYMDHTPGQGQYTVEGSFETYVTKTYGLRDEEAREMVEKIKQWQSQIDWDHLKQVALRAKSLGMSVASHDDDSPAKVDEMIRYGITISEFPVNLQAARRARERGIHVLVGAPNVVRGGSHANNLRAMDAILAGCADMLCSDYHPASFLPAVFKMVKEGIDLPRATRMVSLHPAKALGIEGENGSIEVGKRADLILVELYQGYPIVRRTLVGGEDVYHGNPRSFGSGVACHTPLATGVRS